MQLQWCLLPWPTATIQGSNLLLIFQLHFQCVLKVLLLPMLLELGHHGCWCCFQRHVEQGGAIWQVTLQSLVEAQVKLG
eukprot:Skav201298  [mRNA]  locus=scaffold1317:65529:68414:+ [translate_table: standard]